MASGAKAATESGFQFEITPDGLRAALDELGERREKLNAEDEELMKDVTEVLGHAYSVVPVTECATRLKMHRTTVYRVYHPHAA